MQQFHYSAALPYKYIDISVGRVKSDSADLAAHPVYSDAHVSRILRHDDAVAFIQIEHGVFDCKVRYQKHRVKDGLIRMVTASLMPVIECE